MPLQGVPTHPHTSKDASGLKGLYVQLGASQRAISTEGLSFSPLPQPTGVTKEFAPFLCTSRNFTCRYGPSGWPMVGCGCWVYALQPMHLLILCMSGLQQVGFHDYGTLEKSLDHKKYRTWRPCSIRLAPGKLMWIPYGHLVMPSTAAEYASFVVAPWMVPEMARDTTEELWQLIAATIINFAKKHEDKSPWKTVLPAFRVFSQSLFAST